jgi:hypothetical protein
VSRHFVRSTPLSGEEQLSSGVGAAQPPKPRETGRGASNFFRASLRGDRSRGLGALPPRRSSGTKARPHTKEMAPALS